MPERIGSHQMRAGLTMRNSRAGTLVRWALFCTAIVVATCVAAKPVAARPQDEVLSGFYRCASIGEQKVWLDCYYGAAQPVRAAIGLAPAPPSQSKLVASPPAGAVSPGDYKIRDDVVRSVLDCNGLSDMRAWLECYYGAAERVRAQLGLHTRTTKPAPSPVMASDFGLRPKIEKQPQKISSPMAKYEFDKDHHFTVTLTNGQVWRQIEGDDLYAKWDRQAESYWVIISRGMFGSFNLQVAKLGGIYKVHRIQ